MIRAREQSSPRMTVLRDGKVEGEFRTRDIDRVELISTMLGGDIEALRQIGSERRAHRQDPEGDPVLEAQELAQDGVVEPVDLPVPLRHLHMAHAHLTLSDKPFMGAVTAPERARDTVAMAKLAMGEGFVDQNCVLYSVVNTNAPLVMDETMLWALKESISK